MKTIHRSMLGCALVALAAACGQGEEQPPGEATVAPDRPAPALSNPASPTPVGTDVGAVERDTSGGVLANDSAALPGR